MKCFLNTNKLQPYTNISFKMTTTPNYFDNVMACLSQEMIYKLEYATQTFIKELLILKKDQEDTGNKEPTYNWLNLVDHRGRIQHIQGIIERMFDNPNAALLASVISDYFVPEDVQMLRRFVDDYYIHVYKYTQEKCDNKWSNQTDTYNIFNPELYSNMMFELGMYFYMSIHQKFVINQLYHVIDNNEQLK
jgi:hypothetical protein